MARLIPRFAALALLAAALPAQTWNLPERGIAFYQRTRSATGSGAGFAAVEMPAVLCEGELDRTRKFVALSPADVRDLGMWLAFDLKIRRKFKRTVATIHGLRTLEISGSATSVDPDGSQTIKAKITSVGGGRAVGGPMARGGSASLSGTLEVTRTFDKGRGLVTSFKSRLKGDVRAAAGGGRGPGGRGPGGRGGGGPGPGRGPGGRGGGAEGGVLRVRDRWTLDRVERNREPAFKTRVAAAIRSGAEFVKRALRAGVGSRSNVNGLGVDVSSGTLALCLLTLLKAEVDKKDPVIQKGFAELRRRVLEDTYSIAVALMAMEALYAPLNERDLLISGRIKQPIPRRPSAADQKIMQQWVTQLLKHFDTRQRPAYLLRFNYTEGVPRYDNSNTQYALLGLYSAHLCEVPISATTWFANAQSWLADQSVERGVKLRFGTTSHAQYAKVMAADAEKAAAAAAAAATGQQRTVARMRSRRTVSGRSVQAAGWPYVGSFGQGGGRTRGGGGGPMPRVRPSTASMTTAGLTGVTICQAVLRQARKGGKLIGRLSTAKRKGLAWMYHEFSVRTNKNNGRHYHYYLYGLERACEINQIALLGHRDWYFEGANMLVEMQNKAAGGEVAEGGRFGGRGGGLRSGPGSFQGAGVPQTCMAILFLKQSAPPMPVITGGR